MPETTTIGVDCLTGGCACGAVRYDVPKQWEFSFHCHCRKCQHLTGTGHAPAFAVKKAETTLLGPLKYFEQSADSGARTRSGFCETCGSPIVSMSGAYPDRFYFLAATLDDPSAFNAQFVVFGAQAQPWDPVDPSL